MNSRLRRVAKLRLRSSDEALNRRGAILIEDALNTASLPHGDGARVLVIRKLSLGSIRATDAPSSIALRIEARCRQLAAGAVHALAAEAPAAPAVFFDDDLEAYVLLAVRLACHGPATAWFWPLAARGWQPAMSRDESMRALLAGALASSAGPMAALSLVRALVMHRAIDALATALRQQDGMPLLQACTWSIPPRALPAGASVERPPDAPEPALEQMALPWFAVWGPNDPRSLWLACMLYAVGRPALSAQSALLPAKAAAWMAAAWSDSPRPAPAACSAETLVEPSNASQSPANATTTPALEEVSPGRRPRANLATRRAGLFFLIPAMQRLGMPQWLTDNPALASWSIPHLILHALAARLKTSPRDPVLAALDDPPEDLPAEVRDAVRHWIRRLRRHCRLSAGIGLHTLVCRPGRIAFTETHIDILLDIDSPDIRIRRAGLDLDPGWIPWFARVVLFHYVALEAADA